MVLCSDSGESETWCVWCAGVFAPCPEQKPKSCWKDTQTVETCCSVQAETAALWPSPPGRTSTGKLNICTPQLQLWQSESALANVAASPPACRSVFRHYRVTQRDQGGYVIDVENPVSVLLELVLFKIACKMVWDEFGSLFQIPCADLHEVIDALVEKTAGTLQPFLLEEPYEENISTMLSTFL